MPNQNHGNVHKRFASTRHDVESFASCCEKNRAGEGFKLEELLTIPCIGLEGTKLAVCDSAHTLRRDSVHPEVWSGAKGAGERTELNYGRRKMIVTNDHSDNYSLKSGGNNAIQPQTPSSLRRRR